MYWLDRRINCHSGSLKKIPSTYLHWYRRRSKIQCKISPILISSTGCHESKTLRRLQADVTGSNNTTTTTTSYSYSYTRVSRRKHCKRKHKQTGAKHHYCNKHIDPNKISADLEANVWTYQHSHSGRGFRDTQGWSGEGKATDAARTECTERMWTDMTPSEGKEGRQAGRRRREHTFEETEEKLRRRWYEWIHNEDLWAQIS